MDPPGLREPRRENQECRRKVESPQGVLWGPLRTKNQQRRRFWQQVRQVGPRRGSSQERGRTRSRSHNLLGLLSEKHKPRLTIESRTVLLVFDPQLEGHALLRTLAEPRTPQIVTTWPQWTLRPLRERRLAGCGSTKTAMMTTNLPPCTLWRRPHSQIAVCCTKNLHFAGPVYFSFLRPPHMRGLCLRE